MEMSGGLSSRMIELGRGCRGARGMDRLVLVSWFELSRYFTSMPYDECNM